MRLRAAGIACHLIALAVALPCLAREPLRYGLRYAGRVDCSFQEDLKERVRRHTARVELVEAGAGEADVGVTIAEEPTGFVATVRLARRDGAEVTRVVPAASCTEVVDATALVVAILVDPEGVARGDAAASGATSALTPAVDPQVASAPALSAPGLAPELPPAGPPPSAPPPSQPQDVDAPGWIFGVGAGAELVFGIGPGVAPGFGLGASMESRSAGLFSPVFDVGVHYARGGRVERDAGDARATLLSGRLAACPLRSFASNTVWLAPCVAAELGRLEVSPIEVARSRSAEVLWSAFSATGRLGIGAGALRAHLEAGVAFRASQDRFFFEPDEEVLKLPVIVPVFGFGLRLVFP